MIPYHDENETQRTAFVTLLLIAANAAAWLLVQGGGAPVALEASVVQLGLVPARLSGQSFLTSMFLHGSWAHLLGNMWFLWLFGNNVEDAMTRPRFIVFYLACGLAAAAAQIASSPGSAVPMVGASGAISGVMGAYLVLYPGARVWTLVPLGMFTRSVALPAWVMLLYWAGLQLLGGFSSAAAGAEGGVAFWAHAGGFAAGVVLVKLFAVRARVADHRSRGWRPRGAN